MSASSRKEILELLAQRKISAGEAADMLNAVATAVPPPPSKPASVAPLKARANGKRANWFKVRVSNMETGKNKASVNIPVGMLKFGLKMGGRFAPELDGVDFDEMQSLITEGEEGMLVEVQDEESNEHVRIFLE